MQAFCVVQGFVMPAHLPAAQDGRAHGSRAHGRLQRQCAGHDAPQQRRLCLLQVCLQQLPCLPVLLLRLPQLQRLRILTLSEESSAKGFLASPYCQLQAAAAPACGAATLGREGKLLRVS